MHHAGEKCIDRAVQLNMTGMYMREQYLIAIASGVDSVYVH